MDRIKKKTVVHVLKSSVYSGAEQVAFTIIKGLRNEYNYIYIATDGPIREVLEREQMPFILLKEFSLKNLKKVLKEVSPDLIHAHDFSATVLSVLSGRFRVISHLHYDPPWARKWNVKTLTYVLVGKRISRILAVSGRAYRNLIFSDLLVQKAEVISNPIDRNHILKMGGAEQEKTYDLLFVGRLVEQKAPLLFIKLVEQLKQAGLNVHCAMIGAGKLEVECRSQIIEKGLQENIEQLGFQENPYSYMKAAKILCMTSSWEGYGLVAAEANILGIPVLSTRTGGVTELFGNDAEELCTDTEDFLRKIHLLLTDEKQYQIWCDRALKRSETFETPEVYVKKIDLLYKKEMEKK